MEEKKANYKSPKCQPSHVEILDQIRPATRLLRRLASLAGLNRRQMCQRITRKPHKAQEWREMSLSTGERARRESLVVMPQGHPPQGRTGLRKTTSKEPSQAPTGASCERRSDIWLCHIHKTNHSRHRSNRHFLADTLGL